MDLDQLHTFLEIVRLKSFSKAALSCYRTQPAVSAQVRQLEQELNAPLFERLGTKIALTPAGRIFADHAEQTRRVAGREADVRAFLLLRPYLKRAVKVETTDPADPAPYWLLSSRRPDDLAAAVNGLTDTTP